MSKLRFQNIALFGDNQGIPMLLNHIPKSAVKCIVGAAIRPQYLSILEHISKIYECTFLIQPRKTASEYTRFVEQFRDMNLDLIMCLSYSMMISKDILMSVTYNAVNTHCSLLPFNRGPNPENWTLIKGENLTGVTMHYMNDEVDSGDIIAQSKVFIDIEDTWISLLDKLRISRDALLSDQVNNILMGINSRWKQDDSAATKNLRLTADFPKINFDQMDDMQIYNLIRAQVAPLKGAFIEKRNERIHFDKFLPFSEVKNLRKSYA